MRTFITRVLSHLTALGRSLARGLVEAARCMSLEMQRSRESGSLSRPLFSLSSSVAEQ